MKAPDQPPALKAAYADAAETSASAMRRDDDATCHRVIGDALAKAGRSLK